MNQATWYAARSAGIVAWCLLALSMLWGLALSTGVFGRRPRPSWLLDLHRFLGGFALAFTGVHVIALIADNYVHFGAADVLVPFASGWHPVAVAWGIVAAWMALAVEVTSLARHRLSADAWRRVHYTSFAVFVLATIHGLSAGTDTRSFFAIWVALAMTATLAPLVYVRVTGSGRGPDARARSRAVLGRNRRSRDALGATSSAIAPRSGR
jgi:predicted ferric reductase